MSAEKPKLRIVSMDQFRGYTVAGMFLVNYIDHYPVHEFLDGMLVHNGTHFSWADSIMPSFMFCAGFSYRLTAIRRFQELGTVGAMWSYIRRSLALVAISLFIFGFGGSFNSYSQINGTSVHRLLTKLLCSNLWETLGIIGVCQLLLLPVITRGFKFRLAMFFGLAAFHVWLAASFNYAFQSRQPNWFTSLTGLPGGGFDGGLFGPFGWSIPMLAGTLAYDVLMKLRSREAGTVFLASGVALMVTAYGLNCLTRLYDWTPSQMSEIKTLQGELEKLGPTRQRSGTPEERQKREEVLARLKELREVRDPVIPRSERWSSPGIGWAEAPFVRPPNEKTRGRNYWMMAKGKVTLPFTFFATGFALALYSLFVWGCDVGEWTWGVFRTLGMNPLAGYVIHELTYEKVQALMPTDAPMPYIVLSFVFFFWVNWLALRYLEKQKLFFRM